MFSLNNIKMKPKLIGLFLVAGIIPIAIVGFFSNYKAQNALQHEAMGKLMAVREIKQKQIESFFNERRGDMGVLVETVDTLRNEAFKKLNAVNEIKKNQIEAFFNQKVAEATALAADPFIARAFKELDEALDAGGGYEGGQFKGYGNEKFDAPDAYHLVHDRFFPTIKAFMTQYGYYDIILMCPDHGDISLTVSKESDFGQRTRLIDSSLKDAWAATVEQGRVFLSDMKPYAPSNDAPGQFITAPIKEGGETIGVLGIQISNAAITAMMNERSGMGKTGETFLVGPDKRMRSDSFLDPKGHSVLASFSGNVKENGVDTTAVNSALSGKAGADVIMDNNNNPVLSSWTPVKVGGFTWALLSEIDVAEAFSPVDDNGDEFFVKYQKAYGYYDLFLFNPDGYCFYSAAKEADYQTNLVTGKYKDSGLGRLVQKVLKTKGYGMMDFSPYAPSDNEPAGFIAQPVLHEGDVEIVVALQLSLEAINAIMQQRGGMGETGETILVGPDYKMRSDSFRDPENHSVKASFKNPEKGKVDTFATRAVFESGSSGTATIMDYINNKAMIAYTPVNIGEFTWSLNAKIDEAEVLKPVKTLRMSIILISVVIALVVVAGAYFIARMISSPLLKGVEFASAVARGDLTASIDVDQKDEIGILAQSLTQMAVNLRDIMQELNDTTNNLSGASEELSSVSTQMALSAEEMDAQSTTVAVGAGQVSANVGTVASAAEQSSSSVSNIAAMAEEMSATISNVADSAHKTSEKAGKMAQNSESISSGISTMAA